MKNKKINNKKYANKKSRSVYYSTSKISNYYDAYDSYNDSFNNFNYTDKVDNTLSGIKVFKIC